MSPSPLPAEPAAASHAAASSLVGTRLTLDVEKVAAGGVCVARHDGRVVFVRHTLPGERVVAEVREGGEDSRFLRADAVEVLRASPDRVPEPCPYAGPGRCGGCDWQHVRVDAQRQLKARLVEEQLQRLAGLERTVVVETVPTGREVEDGLGWRTRMQFAIDELGRPGLRRARSHDVEILEGEGPCRIAAPEIEQLGFYDVRWPGVGEVEVAVDPGSDASLLLAAERGPGVPVFLPDLPPTAGLQLRRAPRASGPRRRGGGRLEPVRGREALTPTAAGRRWRVSAGSFWQVHPGAADALAGAVLEGLAPRPGETALDLYAGVGLFAGCLAPALGPTGQAFAVEGGRGAVADARVNLSDVPIVRLVAERVDRALTTPGMLPERVDLVVLDPPRSGAGAAVVGSLVARAPRRIAYVACDPAALARDLATFAAGGYELVSLRGFDLFPMTQHVECVAILGRKA